MSTKLKTLMKNRLAFLFLLLILLLLVGWFYWFQYRASSIRKNCYEWSRNRARELYRRKVDLSPGEPSDKERTIIEQGMFLKADQDNYYEDCLHKEGLK